LETVVEEVAEANLILLQEGQERLLLLMMKIIGNLKNGMIG